MSSADAAARARFYAPGRRVRSNRALSTICEESVTHPREEDYASHLRFYTKVMTRLED